MTRRDRYYLGHVYQPTTPRHAYGRQPFSRPLVEELPHYVSVRFPEDAPTADAPYVAGGARRVAVPMPHGGVRWLLECPRCGRHVSRLYYRADLWNDPPWKQWRSGLCRTCWGFGYASQYTGRRPEAARERVDALRQAARATRDPETRQRRLDRAYAAESLRLGRSIRHDRRKSQAFNLAVLPVLLRFDARIRRGWVRVLRAALREPADRRRALAEDPRTPTWVAAALRATLGDAPEPSAEPEDGAAIISVEQLERLRAEYRAATQSRQRRKAA